MQTHKCSIEIANPNGWRFRFAKEMCSSSMLLSWASMFFVFFSFGVGRSSSLIEVVSLRSIEQIRDKSNRWWVQFEEEMRKADITWEEILERNPPGDERAKKAWNNWCKGITGRMVHGPQARLID